SLGDGSRVSKLDPLVRAYGEVDELNSLLGWAPAACGDERLPRIQNEPCDLPGGGEAASRLHVARAVCRRAEREVLAAAEERPVNPLVAVYLNRLSDLLFILARAANRGGGEPLWLPGGERGTA